jgi:hypothetical protein
MSSKITAEDNNERSLSFPEALAMKKAREALGHGTTNPEDTRSEQLEQSDTTTQEAKLESKQADETNEAHDHTTNVPR